MRKWTADAPGLLAGVPSWPGFTTGTSGRRHSGRGLSHVTPGLRDRSALLWGLLRFKEASRCERSVDAGVPRGVALGLPQPGDEQLGRFLHIGPERGVAIAERQVSLPHGWADGRADVAEILPSMEQVRPQDSHPRRQVEA